MVRQSKSAILACVLIAAGVLASALAGATRTDISHANDLFILFPLGLAGVFLGSITGAGYVFARPQRADGMLGVGVYLLLLAGGMGSLLPLWLPEDNTVLGSAVLAALLAGGGAALTLASGLLLRGTGRSAAVAIATAAAVGLLFVALAGGLVYPLAQVRLPLVAVALVLVIALVMVGRSNWRTLAPTLARAVGGGVVTIGVLVVRGPGDWATASTSLRLYSFPILLMALGIGLAIMNGGCARLARGRADRLGSRRVVVG